MPTNLFNDLGRSGWHSSIMTTYSVDPAFYDGSIAYRLRGQGCVNNILLADAVMLSRALSVMPEGFRNAGRRYAVAPATAPGCFHPKLHLRLGTDRARLVIASANATAAGWGRNREALAAFDWRLRSDDPAEIALGPLIRRAYDYLLHWLQPVAGQAMDFKLRLHRRDAPWLGDLAPASGAVDLPDGSGVALLCDTGGDSPSLMRQFMYAVAGARARRLIVVSPYWDFDLAGLTALHAALGDCPMTVALDPQVNTFPVDALAAGAPVEFVSLGDRDGGRFVHAKLILVETDAADHLLVGSANCSDEALGTLTRGSRNAEASLYRRLPPGAVRAQLGIDLTRTLERTAIRRVDPASDPFPGGAAPAAGVVEVAGAGLLWFPPAGVSPAGAVMLAGEDELVLGGAGGRWRAELPPGASMPRVVRIRFADGRASVPIIVHDHAALRIAAPGLVGAQLRDAFARVLAGEDDLIDLALQAHRLFEPGGGSSAARAHPAVRRDDGFTAGSEYQTAEAFRQAIARPARGESGQLAVDDPGLLDLLAIVLRGVIDVGHRAAEAERDASEDDDALAGETEDGEEGVEPYDQTPTRKPDTPSGGPVETRIYTAAEIKERRRRLGLALDGFEVMLKRLQTQATVSVGQVTAQTAFILGLMVYACVKDHPTTSGKPVRLMSFAVTPGAEANFIFARCIGRVLQQLWSTSRPLMARALIETRHSDLPDDLVMLIVMSRWAVARACQNAVDSKAASLLPIVRRLAFDVFRLSASFGPIASDAEEEFLRRLDSRLGFTEDQTRVLVRSCREFEKEALKPSS